MALRTKVETAHPDERLRRLMTNIFYLTKCIDNLKGRFNTYTETLMREASYGQKDPNPGTKDISYATTLIFGSETELPPELPGPVTVPMVIDENLKFNKNFNSVYTQLTVTSLSTFMKHLIELDAEIEQQPQEYPSSTAGVNLHKILLFFLTFIEIYTNMISKKNESNCDWNELLANHFLANFSLTLNEDQGRIHLSRIGHGLLVHEPWFHLSKNIG